MIENIFELLCNWFNSVQKEDTDQDYYDTLYYVNDVYGIKLPYHYVEDILEYCDDLNRNIDDLEEETSIQKDYIRFLRKENAELKNAKLKQTEEGLKS